MVARQQVTEDRDYEPAKAIRQARLKKLIASQPSNVAGKIEFIDLSDLRRDLGPLWQEKAERIHRRIDELIEDFIPDDGLFCRYSENAYIVVIPRFTESQLRTTRQKILETLGREFGSRNRTAEEDGPVNRDDAVAEAGAGPATARADSMPVKPVAERRALLHRFFPVWDLYHKVISTYACYPCRETLDGGLKIMVGQEPVSTLQLGDWVMNRDLRALEYGASMLDELVRNSFRLFLRIPVHYQTLASRTCRRPYVSFCRELPPYLHKLLVFELFGAPPGATQTSMFEVVNVIRPFCQNILYRTEPGRAMDFSNLFALGILGVGCDFSNPLKSERQIMSEIEAFAVAAEKAGLRADIHGVRTSSLALFAWGAGATFVSGGRVGVGKRVPDTMLRFDWREFYCETDLQARMRS
jgi:hypothetical protein